MLTAKLAKVAAGLALVAGAGLVSPSSQARAVEPVDDAGGGVYLWKDLSGKCPTTCDNNTYKCPCTT